MLAIIKTGGKQYKVQPGDKVKIEKIEGQAGDVLTFKEVLLGGDENNVTVGAPLIDGAVVEGKILRQAKADKVITIKHHAKKRYKKKMGHRQQFTEVEITNISLK